MRHAPGGYSSPTISRATVERFEYRKASGKGDGPDYPEGLYAEWSGVVSWPSSKCILPGVNQSQADAVIEAIYKRFPDTCTLLPSEPHRSEGRWPHSYDLLWQKMIERLGRQNGTREMISLLDLGQRAGSDQLTRAITQAVELGCADAAAVRYLLTATEPLRKKPDVIELGLLARYERPLPTLEAYDHLLRAEVAR